MVYVEVVLAKEFNMKTMNIQSKSKIKATLHSHLYSGRKFPHRRLGKKMPSTEIANEMVIYLATSSNDEKIGCTQAERHAIEATMKGKLVHNTFIEMVANETT